MGEEIGWRAFALPRLLATLEQPVVASLFLGLVWGLWHVPTCLLPGQASFPIALFLLLHCGLSLIYSVLFGASQGSLVGVVLLHASTDMSPRLLTIADFTLET